MLTVFFANLVGFAAHATKNFDSRNHVVAIEPGRQGIFAAAKQDGTVALLGEYAVKIVYPKCETSPDKEGKRNCQTRACHNGNPFRSVRQETHLVKDNGSLREIAESQIAAHGKHIQRNQVTQESVALKARNRIFPAEHKEHHVHDNDEPHKPPVFELRKVQNRMFYNNCIINAIRGSLAHSIGTGAIHRNSATQERNSPKSNYAQVQEHLPELRNQAREHAHKGSKQNTKRHQEVRDKVKVTVLFHKDKHGLIEIQVRAPAARTATLALKMQNVR